jgi:hypothetical protein
LDRVYELEFWVRKINPHDRAEFIFNTTMFGKKEIDKKERLKK